MFNQNFQIKKLDHALKAIRKNLLHQNFQAEKLKLHQIFVDQKTRKQTPNLPVYSTAVEADNIVVELKIATIYSNFSKL
jgi:hypothetical protein